MCVFWPDDSATMAEVAMFEGQWDWSGHSMNKSNETCFEFTKDQLKVVYALKSCIASLAIIACGLVVFLVLCFKGYREFVYRLVLYLMIPDILESLTNILEWLPVHSGKDDVVSVKKGWGGMCTAVAFLNQISLWMESLVICWIVLYMLTLTIRILKTHTMHNQLPNDDETQRKKCSKAELFGVLFCMFFPFTFNWLPFVWGMYGLSGAWCWIKLTQGDCHSSYKLGLSLMFVLLYGPLLLVMLFGLFTLTFIAIILCVKVRGHKDDNAMYRKGMLEIVMLMAYPIVDSLICSLLVVNRIYYSVYTVPNGLHPSYPLWLAQAIADPARELIPPIAFLLHPGTYRKLMCRKEQTDTYFDVEAEDSDIQGYRVMDTAAKKDNYGATLLI